MLQLSHAATKTPRGEQPALGSPQHAQYHRWRGTCVRQTQVRDLSFERDQAEGTRQIHVAIIQMVSLAFSQNRCYCMGQSMALFRGRSWQGRWRGSRLLQSRGRRSRGCWRTAAACTCGSGRAGQRAGFSATDAETESVRASCAIWDWARRIPYLSSRRAKKLNAAASYCRAAPIL